MELELGLKFHLKDRRKGVQPISPGLVILQAELGQATKKVYLAEQIMTQRSCLFDAHERQQYVMLSGNVL